MACIRKGFNGRQTKAVLMNNDLLGNDSEVSRWMKYYSAVLAGEFVDREMIGE